MKTIRFHQRFADPGIVCVLGFCLAAQMVQAQGYKQVNLVSDEPGLAPLADPNLVNPWGIVITRSGRIWISDNGTGVSTVYNPNGTPRPIVVTIPPPEGSTDPATPTGLVINNTEGFSISDGTNTAPSLFIWATEDGTIAGWNPSVNPTSAVLVVDHSMSNAVYKGIARASDAASNEFVFVSNFHDGVVEKYDASFQFIASFTDVNLPSGYAPFGIRTIGGRLFVTFALQDDAQHDDVAGAGHGFIDVFDTDGTLLRRFASQGSLNSPWGLAVAPAGFGPFSGALLVGNFGDGHITAFDLASGQPLGQLFGPGHQPIVIQGLWGLTFSEGDGHAMNGGSDGSPLLYFTAGIDDENHGLFGFIRHGGRGGPGAWH